MNFATYDILSKALPGAVVYLALLLSGLIGKPKDISDVLILVVVYLLGYFVDAVASLTEPLLHRMMGGVPSERLLADGYKGRIAVAQRNTLCAHMKQEYPELEPGTREFFGVIASVASTKGSPRLIEFLGAYVFARNILIALIVAELIACLFHIEWYFFFLYAALIVLCYHRAKQRGYYWAREAVNVYIDCRSIGQPKKDTGLTT
jgi:hypothetical protein